MSVLCYSRDLLGNIIKILIPSYIPSVQFDKNAFSVFSVPDISLDTGNRLIDNTLLNTFTSGKKKSHLVLHKNFPSSSNSWKGGSIL